MQPSSLSILIPAAGASERLGQAKQLVEYKGSTLLQRAVNTALSISPLEVIVVTGAHSKAVRSSVHNPGVNWVHNPDWAEGLGASISAGAATVRPESDGLMILLCDQWRIQQEDLEELVDIWRLNPQRIVAATSDGQTMPPVILPSSHFGQLQSLSGVQGAKNIIMEHAELVTAIPLKNAAFDLDTPAHLEALRNKGGH